MENSNFLSALLARIVQKLLDIRENTFRNADIHVDEMYVDWPNNEEHSTQFYPGFRIYVTPKNIGSMGAQIVIFVKKHSIKKLTFHMVCSLLAVPVSIT